MRSAWRSGILAITVIGLSMAGLAVADEIALKDGTKFSGTVLGRDGERVVIALPRASVASVGGETLPEAVTEGSKAPPFEVEDLKGATQTLGAAKGEATLLSFWASWCPHCRSDIPMMNELMAKYGGKGLRIVAVSVDQEVDRLMQFLKDQKLSYPIVAAFKDPGKPAAALPEMYEAQGVPAYFLIDAQGTVVKTYSGSITEGRVDIDSDVQQVLESVPSKKKG